MARYEISNEVRPLDRLITGFASSCGYEIQTVFNDLLRFIIHGFSPGAPPISNWKYKRQQNASFMEMTAEWTRIMQKQIGRSGWFDAFGELHMAYCSKPGQQANGQFFTPSHICELMVMCAAGKKETGQRMGDPTCGSGRLLLAYHAHNPGNYLVGEDISRTCCMMTVCNMLVHGCVGEVICHDSLQPKDSCMTMYTDPILWNEGQQLLGEQIKIYMNDSTIDWAHIINQALTVEMKDSIHYNQVSGKEMKAYFINGDMRHIEVIGNVLTAFYPEEKDSTMTGFNCLEGSVLHLYMKDKKMEKGLFIGKSNGTMYPMDQIPPDKLRLPTFAWFDYVRPLNKDDIFNWRSKRAGETLKPTTDRRPKTEKRNLINMK